MLLGGDHRSVGEFVELVPDEKVVFTFGWDAPGNPITPGSTTAISDGTAEAPVAATISSCATTAFDAGSLNPLAERPPIREIPMPSAAAATARATRITRMGWASETRAMRSSTSAA